MFADEEHKFLKDSQGEKPDENSMAQFVINSVF